MTRWLWNSRFSVDVPDDWTVSESDGVVDAHGDDATETLQVSVLIKQSPTSPSESDASTVAEYWAAKLGLSPAIRTTSSADIAEARFEADQARPEGRTRWLFRAVVTERLSIRASICQVETGIGSPLGPSILDGLAIEP